MSKRSVRSTELIDCFEFHNATSSPAVINDACEKEVIVRYDKDEM